MLQLKNICKKYVTGDLVQTALDNVSVNFRDNEFVAVLGPSGSGKTTLLNVVGGLDRYDSGNLIIRGISTEKYKDRDWDSYRNHTIGFVFQSYNLIPHQSVLANVELALTISGISKRARRERAKKALAAVGLGDQLHKRPNQMSGGQMQRVAIARALVNDPDILLADEPTGALDSETSLQVMELLKEVAKDRLVIMVTHNGELAEQYATRIVRLKDGRITGDTMPYSVEEESAGSAVHRNMGKSSMSFATSLSLSANNLRTKKARTILTAFAGSIGIIGIALILALSTGVNNYIDKIQKDTMTSYPITITAQSIDLNSIMNAGRERALEAPDHEKDAVYANTYMFDMASTLTTSISENNLTAFKRYLDDPSGPIHRYVGETGILYTYDTSFDVYAFDPEGTLTDANSINVGRRNRGMNMGGMQNFSMMNNRSTQWSFFQMLPGSGSTLVSPALTESCDLLYGAWPASRDEVVLFVNEFNEVSMTRLYALGLLPVSEYNEKMQKLISGEAFENEAVSWSYEEILDRTLYLIPECDKYVQGDDGLWTYVGDSSVRLAELTGNAAQLKISGIARRPDDDFGSLVTGTIGYTKALTDYIITYTDASPVVTAQKASPDINVLTGIAFAPKDDEAKAEDAKQYLLNLGVSEKASLVSEYMQSAYPGMMGNASGEGENETGDGGAADEGADAGNDGGDTGAGEAGDSGQSSSGSLFGNLFGGLSLFGQGGNDGTPGSGNRREEQLAAMLDQYLQRNPDPAMLNSIYDTYISSGSYDENMAAFGLVNPDAPSAINIYVDSFEDKDGITDCIDDYNKEASEEDQIVYTDYIGLLLSSVTTIINVISYVLIAFVSVSLIVSSIMIGIITYISVLERTKEIGILRAIGASKRNISQVFNAETFLVGLLAGILGVGVSWLLLLPGNAVIHAVAESNDVNAVLPVPAAVTLVLLSMILTMIGGFIPSKKAARKDPVTALRTE